jgi:hypothetical protein
MPAFLLIRLRELSAQIFQLVTVSRFADGGAAHHDVDLLT